MRTGNGAIRAGSGALRAALRAALLVWGVAAALAVQGQSAPLHHWVAFAGKTDAPNYPYSLDEPRAFLSDRALARRARQGIPVDQLDLPVAPAYVAAINALEGFRVVHTSRWLNGATVSIADSAVSLEPLWGLGFVSEVRRVEAGEGDGGAPGPQALEGPLSPADYGAGWDPLAQLGGEPLHALGFRGEGLWIGVLDAGFENVPTLDVFAEARDQGRIREGRDIVGSTQGVYAHHRHGTMVLGTMTGTAEGELIGTAPEATYYLYRTEDAWREYEIEEDFWIVGAEHADSIGVDILNTSLGYSLFDDSLMNHSPGQMDGRTARISRGMAIAATRGMLCVTSAGNSGATAWRSITAPADAEGILAVGAVDAAGNVAGFSGRGPSADGRVKPEVVARGVAAAYPTHEGTIAAGNGTSFAAPILCGLAACLWQAVPSATSSQVREAILQSASHYLAPNDSLGYGLPDFARAFDLLAGWNGGPTPDGGPGSPGTPGGDGGGVPLAEQGPGLRVFPNPARDVLRWSLSLADLPSGSPPLAFPGQWTLRDPAGRLLLSGTVPDWQPTLAGFAPLPDLPTGLYHFELRLGDRTWHAPFLCTLTN